MIGTKMKVLAVSALLSLAGAVLGSNTENETLKDIAGYRRWTRVTEKPIPVTSFTAAA